MQASNRRQAAFSESQRGVRFVEWLQLKITNVTPFAASRHFPQRGQRGPWLPNGGAVEQSETEGVSFVEWLQLKIINVTPFAASRHETEV